MYYAGNNCSQVSNMYYAGNNVQQPRFNPSMYKGYTKTDNKVEKYLFKCLKATSKNLSTLFKNIVTLITPAEPVTPEELIFMTYIIRVNKKKEGVYKSITAVLKKTKEVRSFDFDLQGRIIVTAEADLKHLLKGFAKASAGGIVVEHVQSGLCSSNLFLKPQYSGYGNGNGYAYGGSNNYNNGVGMYPSYGGGYARGQQMGYGYNYNPTTFNNHQSYHGRQNRPFANRHGMMAPQQPYSFMDDDDMMMKNCPCEI